MTSFFEYNTDFKEKHEKSKIVANAWSNTDPAILAVSSSQEKSSTEKIGNISFYHDEGEPIENTTVLSRPGTCNCLSWHPRSQLLALGWDDGTVQLWSERERNSKDDSDTHKSPITVVVWSPDGSRLITGDQTGTLAVWQGDYKGSRYLTLVCRYLRKGGITNVVFRSASTAQLMQTMQLTNDSSSGCPPFFYGGHHGTIYFADDLSVCSEVVSVPAPLNSMFYSHSGDYIIIVTVDVVLFKFDIQPDSKIVLDKKVKLSIKGDGSELRCVWAGGGLLAAANNENILRMWHLSRDSNYMLQIPDCQKGETVTTIAFNPQRRLLAGGTNTGRVLLWKFIGNNLSAKEPSAEDWEALPSSSSTTGHLTALSWGPGNGLISAAFQNDISILNQTVLHCSLNDGNSAIQMSTDSMLLTAADGKRKVVTTGIRIKGVYVSEEYAVVWNGKGAVEVRNMTDNMFSVASNFNSKAKWVVAKGEMLYLTVDHRLEITSIKGVAKRTINMTDAEGCPIHLDVNKHHLALTTDLGILKVWDITRSEPKPIVPCRSFQSENLGAIKSIQINSTGNKVSILCNLQDAGGLQVPDSKLYVYDVELDRVFTYDFGPDFYPVIQSWDSGEPSLLAVETRRQEVSQSKEVQKVRDLSEYDTDEPTVKPPEVEVTTLFCTSEYGVLMQDSFALENDLSSLMGIEVPYIYFMHRSTEEEEEPRVKKRTMRDFVGLEKVSDETKKDLINFSFNLTHGNMDEAYRSVKKISSETIWENMCQMCVKTKRLDVAEVCLGNMNNARGARAVRIAKQKEPEKEAQVAMVAIQLGLIDDAEKLYLSCGRYDLLVKFYLACGRWKDALSVCAKYDRINLKTTHYLYAKYLESMGDTKEAIKNYEKSLTHRTEVPRMLFDTHQLGDLENYIKATEDPQLIKWWAQYCESNEATDEAVRYYRQANETLSLVRVYCFRDMLEDASTICTQSGDLAACYHLARHFESQDEIKQAINFYKRAKKFNHGVRLAKEHRMDSELMTLALEGGKELKIEAARYFEAAQSYDKAVMLYQKGGKTPRALELCFRAQLFESLTKISENLDTDTDPALLTRCGDFCLENKKYDKAVHLFVTAKKYGKALELCMKFNVPINEKMAEAMTPAKTDDNKDARQDVLLNLAKCCHDQGNYGLACKKFTQAGDKVQAMQCLVKSKNTQKIVFYAKTIKKKEIWILAANYLQKLAWHSEPEVMKDIIQFYTKAKAWQQLAVFYDACAQVEIDEYRDYEKALGALKESLKYIIKTKSMPDKEEKLGSLDARIRLVEQFVQARQLVKTRPQEMVKICQRLLDTPDVDRDSAIRVGDVFALLIEYYHSQQMFQDAYQIIQKMKNGNIILAPYLDAKMVEEIHNQVGEDMPSNGQEENDDDDIGEEIGEDIE